MYPDKKVPVEEVFFLVLLCWLTMNLHRGALLVLSARARRSAGAVGADRSTRAVDPRGGAA